MDLAHLVERADSSMKFVGHLLLFILFAALIWAPLYVLSHLLGLVETTVFLASLATVLILTLIFFPAAREYLKRISRISIAGIEIDLRGLISKSVEDRVQELIFVGLDRRVEYEKATLKEYVEFIENRIGGRSRKIVLTVDMQDPERLDIPMLYFQIAHLLELFDLRVVLFVDRSRGKGDASMIGTLPPERALKLLDDTGQLRVAFASAIARHDGFVRVLPIAEQMPRLWNLFAGEIETSQLNRDLNPEFVHSRLGPELELTTINYPIRRSDLPLLLAHALTGGHHIVILEDGQFRSVRTLDKVAREIMARLIAVAMRQDGDEDEAAAEF